MKSIKKKVAIIIISLIFGIAAGVAYQTHFMFPANYFESVLTLAIIIFAIITMSAFISRGAALSPSYIKIALLSSAATISTAILGVSSIPIHNAVHCILFGFNVAFLVLTVSSCICIVFEGLDKNKE